MYDVVGEHDLGGFTSHQHQFKSLLRTLTAVPGSSGDPIMNDEERDRHRAEVEELQRDLAQTRQQLAAAQDQLSDKALAVQRGSGGGSGGGAAGTRVGAPGAPPLTPSSWFAAGTGSGAGGGPGVEDARSSPLVVPAPPEYLHPLGPLLSRDGSVGPSSPVVKVGG